MTAAVAVAITTSVLVHLNTRSVRAIKSPVVNARLPGVGPANVAPASVGRYESLMPQGIDAFEQEREGAVTAHFTDALPQRGELYDAVGVDDLGVEWLARATDTLPSHGSPLESLDNLELFDTAELFDEDLLWDEALDEQASAATCRPRPGPVQAGRETRTGKDTEKESEDDETV